MLLIVLVHYNVHNRYDDYVDYYLNALLKIKEEKKIVFVSTSPLPQKDRKKLIAKNIHVIERENIGYDFYSYKVGIESQNIDDFSSVLLCNDSVFGPLHDINTIYNSMQNSPNDILSMNESTERNYHLQSYFILFKNKVIRDTSFKKFWNNVKVLSGREEVITEYELGMTPYFIAHDFKLGAYNTLFPSCFNMLLYAQKKLWMLQRCLHYLRKRRPREASQINVTHHLWERLITHHNFPFIKRELLEKNPENLSLTHLEDLVQKHTDYPTELFTRNRGDANE